MEKQDGQGHVVSNIPTEKNTYATRGRLERHSATRKQNNKNNQELFIYTNNGFGFCLLPSTLTPPGRLELVGETQVPGDDSSSLCVCVSE